MPATSAHDEEEQEGILTKKKRPSRSGWGKVEKTRKEASIRFWRCPILQKSNCPPSQLTKFWASPAAGSQCSPSSHQLDWVTQDTMRRTGNQRSPNNLDPRSSPSYIFYQIYHLLCVFHSCTQPGPHWLFIFLHRVTRVTRWHLCTSNLDCFTPNIWSTESPPFHCFSVFHRLFIKRMFFTWSLCSFIFLLNVMGMG